MILTLVKCNLSYALLFGTVVTQPQTFIVGNIVKDVYVTIDRVNFDAWVVQTKTQQFVIPGNQCKFIRK